MEENIPSRTTVNKEGNFKDDIGSEISQEKNRSSSPAVDAAALLPRGNKVKSEPPESDHIPEVPGEELRGVIDASEVFAAPVAVAEELKIRNQQRASTSTSDSQDRFKQSEVSTPLPNNVLIQKEEIENIELNSLGESSLVKLKRRIRLKLLAEEARNSIAKKAEVANAALENEMPFSSCSRRMATRNATSQISSNLQQLQRFIMVKDEKSIIAPFSGKQVRSRRVVDLSSSESEDDHDDKDNITAAETNSKYFQKDHAGERSTYESAFERLFSLGSLLSAAVDSNDSPLTDPSSGIAAAAAAASVGTRKPGLPAKKTSVSSELPGGRKVPDSVSSLVKMFKKGVGANDVPLKLNRQTKNKSLKDRKEAAAHAEESAIKYEQERADNICRNREFLAQLGLSSALHTATAKKNNRGRKPGSKNHVAATELYENHHKIEEILLRNREILDRRAAAAVVGRKRQRLIESDLHDKDDDNDDDDIVPDVGVGDHRGKRQKRNSRSSKRMSPKEQNEHYRHSTSSARKSKKGITSSKEISSSAERGKIPRAGRRRSIPASVINGLTASNQQLIRFVQELMLSASSSLPQTLRSFRATGSTDAAAADGDDSDQSSPRKGQEFYDPNDDTSQHEDEGSPRLSGESGRKRKDSWLTAIPFETPKTEYELERDDILRRQKDQFGRLGIVSELVEERQPSRTVRPYCRRWPSEPDPAYQRNTRFQNRQRKSSGQPDAAAAAFLNENNIALTGTRSLLEVRSVSCASSLVAKFTGGCKLDTGHGTPSAGEFKTKLEVTDEEVVGFQPRDGTWLDSDLTRIYTMDIAPINSSSSQKKGLLAAGGSQGRLAVFAIPDDDPGSSSTDHDSTASVSKAPLLSWTVDSSWVSQVLFLSNQFQENGTLLLSSSNDGKLVLWDINRQRVRSGTRGLSPLTREGIPVVVCETSTLHAGGIFGMHESRGRIASSSEGSVAISTIKETGIVVERSITGHHAGVIRSVRFREQNILADCGVDAVIGILDLRASDPCTLRIRTTHKTGISMIEWSTVCLESSLLMSASNDPQIHLHDIRYPANAMLQFEGHVHPRRVKCYSMYRPTFVAGGDAVVTSGEGTHQLSLYSVTTGRVMRKLHVGYDPNILLWNSSLPKQGGGLWAACRGITKFQALWQQRRTGG